MAEQLHEASWKVKYDKPHYAEWAKSLNGRIRTGGMWKSARQMKHFYNLATVQPGSKNDAITRNLHRDARRYLPAVKPSSKLLITRYQASPGNGEWFSKIDVFEFNEDGLIRKWRVSRPKYHGGQGAEVPDFRWSRAEVVWKRTGYRETKADQRVLPRSNVSAKQAEQIARYIARRHRVNTMGPDRLRQVIMKGIVDKVNPIVSDYKKALLYRLGRMPRAPQNMRDWDEVIATDVEKVVASFPAAATKKAPELPNYGRKNSRDEDDHFDAQFREYAANNLGAEDPGVAAELRNAAGYNPYESKDAMQAAIRVTGTDVAAIGVLKEGDDRKFWIEMANGGVFHYSKDKNEFSKFKDELTRELGEGHANRLLFELRDRSREVARSSK